MKVRGLQVHGARVPRAVAGQRVAVNLGGVDTADVLRGQTIAPAGAFSSTRVVDVRIETARRGEGRAPRRAAQIPPGHERGAWPGGRVVARGGPRARRRGG